MMHLICAAALALDILAINKFGGLIAGILTAVVMIAILSIGPTPRH